MVETINRYAGLWLDWQWSMLWQTAVLVGVVALIDRLVRRWAWPQLRYALWLLVLLKLMLPPTLTSPVSVTSTVPALAQKAMVTRMATPPATDHAISETPLVAKAKASVSDVTPAPVPSLVTLDPKPVSPVPVAGPAATLSWNVYAMGVWLLGVLALSIGLIIYLRRLAVEHREERPDEVPHWFDEVLAQAATEIKLRRVPRIVFSTKVCCPAVFGLFRPVLLVPADQIATMTRLEVRHVLLHELAHIKRGDLLMHSVYMVLVTLYWFNPLLWLIRKHVQNLRELCCDATVARCLREETHAYRDTLLATGRALLARPVDPGLGLLGLFENSGWLTVRLHWLGKRTWRYPWLRRTLVATVVALMLCCVLPMAALRADQDDASADEYKVTLANGTTIELIGLYSPTHKRWWRPDGTPLDEPPYDSPHIDDSPPPPGAPQTDDIEFAVRYENFPKGATGRVQPHIGGGSWGGEIPASDADVAKTDGPLTGVTYVVAQPSELGETGDVKVRLATGPWKTHTAWSESPGRFLGMATGKVRFLEPYERDGRTKATVIHLIEDHDARVTVLDTNNVEHEPSSRGGMSMRAGTSRMIDVSGEFDVLLDRLKAINLQTRPYTYVEFKNISLHPKKQQNVKVITVEPLAAGKDFCATLSDGTTIELLGLYSKTLKRWWRPDGTPLEEGPYDPDVEHIVGADCTEIAIRHSNLPEGAHGRISADLRGGGWGGTIPMWYATAKKDGQTVEDVAWVDVTPLGGPEATTVTVSVATGPWQTYAFSSQSSNGFNARTGRDSIFAKPYERDGKTYVTVTHAIEGRNVRVTVTDANNVEHASEYKGGLWTAAGFSQITPYFDVALGDVALVNLQTRPYSLVEFKNVSLIPGKFRNVQIDMTEDAKESGERKADIAALREWSPRSLRAFHAAVTAHLHQEGVVGLPDRPWALEFRIDDPNETNLYVSPVTYVTGVGYFGPEGYRALRPEHFTSAAASETPIMYSKNLLKAERGKGTHILFGDGRVEWVTARELNRLKDMGMPRQVRQ